MIFTRLFSLMAAISFIGYSNAQCDPATVAHYNMGDFPVTTSAGVTITMSGTNSGTLGPYGPYGCSPAECEANTIRLDPGDATTFTFSQPVEEVVMILGVMNTSENGSITTNGATPILTTNCLNTETQITGNAFEQIGALASPVLTITIPGGATQVTVNCFAAAQTNGVFTIDLLDCVTPNCTPSSSSISPMACDTYSSPSGKVWTSSGMYLDTIPNASGCDSIISIDLTVNNSTASTDVVSACDSYTWIDGNTYTSNNNTATYVMPNQAGCDSTITLDLTVNTTPINTVSQTGAELTADASGANYQWIDCGDNNSIIAGETSQSFIPTPITGNYAVEVTLNGCTDTSACYLVDYTGVDEHGDMIFTLYPNPTENGQINIDFEGGIRTIEVLDMTGRVIELPINVQNGTVDGSKLESGKYIVRLVTNEDIILQKEVVVIK
jgi:hypothetical protein